MGYPLKNRFHFIVKLGLALSTAILFSGPASADQRLPLTGYSTTACLAQNLNKHLDMIFDTKSEYPNVCWRSPSANGWNWSQRRSLAFRITNPEPFDVTFGVRVDDSAGNHTQVQSVAPAKSTQLYYWPLQKGDTIDPGAVSYTHLTLPTIYSV